MSQKNICLETSSLIPLIVSTPYTIRISDYIYNNSKDKYYIFKDSIREAKNTKFLQIDSYQSIIKSKQSHSNYILSILSNLNESFSSQNIQHNFARGCMMFIMDILDSVQISEKTYKDFCDIVYSEITKKIESILSLISKDKFNLNPSNIFQYWQIDNNLNNFNINITVIDDEESESTKNKDRDIYHYKQFYDQELDLLLVCDSGFKKQIKDLKEYSSNDIKKIIHFNKT